jgi:hypothetical protein
MSTAGIVKYKILQNGSLDGRWTHPNLQGKTATERAWGWNAGHFRASVLAGRGEHARATNEANRVARQEGLGQVNDYNIACVFAISSRAAENDGKLAPRDRGRLKAQYADRAIEFLRLAVAKGLQIPSALTSDPDLAVLRSREDFQKLVQEVEQKSKK